MSDKVIDLDANRPHVSSLAICVSCSYRWVAVILADAKRYDLECPRCNKSLGVMIGESNER